MSREVLQYTLSEQDNFTANKGHREKTLSATIISSNPILGIGLQNILSESCFSVSSVVDSGQVQPSTIALWSRSLFVVDWSGVQPDTIECIKTIRERQPEARIAVVADKFSLEKIKTGLALGVGGFCLTSSTPEVLIKSLELVMLKEIVIPSAMVNTIFEGASAGHAELQDNDGEAKAYDPKARKLSTRESEILGCLMQGASNKLIARKLEVTEATVKVHVKAILRKIGAANRTQAAIWATDHLPEKPAQRPNI
jgi:two-component system nitrate/nitrite response regulator NarL